MGLEKSVSESLKSFKESDSRSLEEAIEEGFLKSERDYLSWRKRDSHSVESFTKLSPA